MNEQEIVIAKLKIHKDRMDARIRKLEKEFDEMHNQALQHARNKDKDKALHCIRKKKRIKEYKANAYVRIDFIENQIYQIESAEDDVAFTKTLKESNKVLKKLNEEIDIEEIQIAKELQQEGQIKKDVLQSMLGENDKDLEDEINMIEAEMMDKNFAAMDDIDIANTDKNRYTNRHQQNPSREVLQMRH